MNIPCKLDHNAECLICDCWLSNCAWQRLLNKDFTYESEEELKEMFKDFKENDGRSLIEIGDDLLNVLGIEGKFFPTNDVTLLIILESNNLSIEQLTAIASCEKCNGIFIANNFPVISIGK